MTPAPSTPSVSTQQFVLALLVDEDGREERWRPIADFPRYEVSDFGRVRSLIGTPKILKGGTKYTETGRIKCHHVTLCAEGTGSTVRRNGTIHQLVLEAFVGPCPPGMVGCHNDGSPLHNRLENLRWDTHLENAADSIRHGTQVRGETHHATRLTEDDVRCIKAEPNFRGVTTMLGRAFGVEPYVIERVRRGETWKHVSA